MSLYYDQYLHHFQIGQQALAEKRNADARRELLLASRFILLQARDDHDEQLREVRINRGLRLRDLVARIPAETSAGNVGVVGGLPGAAPALPTHSDESHSKWQVEKKPGVWFRDIAGLTDVKEIIERRVIFPFRNPQLAETYGRKPGGGVLMYGPPGTGKTMMARAIATELEASFYNVQCSDIMSKWVGEAEQNLRELFEAARSSLPAVIFLDETEALIARRGGHSTVMNRLIPEFLAQIDGLKSGPSGILMLGATNRPWDLDPAAMRHGRFGEHIYVGLPDLEARKFMLSKKLSVVPLLPEVDTDMISERTEGMTGADVAGLVERIIDPAFDRAIESGIAEPVTTHDVERALSRTRPSVSAKDLKRYQQFRDSGE